jgi:amino acid adenylation domain-containing protein
MQHTTVPERITGWAWTHPGHAAVVHGDRSLSYAELVERAGALAARLREHGVGRDTLVPLWLDRSPELVVAALAVWFAGGAYVGMDVTEPAARAEGILADCASPVVLTTRALAAQLPAGAPTAIVIDESVPPPGAPASLPSVAGSDAGYVTFTSGSTGRPKGVLLEHQGITNLVAWYADTFGVRPGDRIPQLARPSFDGWALEVWPCLGAGATLCIMEKRLPDSAQDCVDWLEQQGVTVAFFTTVLAVQLLRARWSTEGTSMRAMLFGGEKLHALPAGRPPFRLYHVYGPTETTMLATCGEIEDGGPAGMAPPIGHPLPGLTAYVLGENRRPVADGEPGELCLSGAAVGRGYVNQPELSAQRFRDDPFTDRPGVRMYATGDLVRRLPDGQFAFLGRIDDQIKLRGFRIEPGEVERALVTATGVMQAAVVVREGDGDDASRRLVGYWVAVPDAAVPDESELRESLGAALPPYMIPHVLLRTEALPLTAHGKTDRRALAARPLPVAADVTAEAFQGPTEQLLAELWGRVLGRAPTSRQDSFFDLGGDSLLAMRLANEGRRHGLRFGAEDLFETDVLWELAESIERSAAPAGGRW